jgi:hypothetical protein
VVILEDEWKRTKEQVKDPKQDCREHAQVQALQDAISHTTVLNTGAATHHRLKEQ